MLWPFGRKLFKINLPELKVHLTMKVSFKDIFINFMVSAMEMGTN